MLLTSGYCHYTLIILPSYLFGVSISPTEAKKEFLASSCHSLFWPLPHYNMVRSYPRSSVSELKTQGGLDRSHHTVSCSQIQKINFSIEISSQWMMHKSSGSSEQEQWGKRNKMRGRRQPAISQVAAGKVIFSHFYQLRALLGFGKKPWFSNFPLESMRKNVFKLKEIYYARGSQKIQ